MNIYLIPYTWLRHIVMGLVVGASGMLAWFWVLWLYTVANPYLWDSIGVMWSRGSEGPMLMTVLASTMAFSSMMAEGSLRRRRLRWRWTWALLATFITWLGTLTSYGIWAVMIPFFGPKGLEDLMADSGFVTLRYRLPIWCMAGAWSGIGPFLVRRFAAWMVRRWGWGKDTDVVPPSPSWLAWFQMLFAHLGGATVAAALAAAVWHFLGHQPQLTGDLYIAMAFAALTWGFWHGALVWPIPEDMYAGWIRVLSAERYGQRIPVPHIDGKPAERFLGHFPRGLDLYLPLDRGVAELHASFIVDEDQRYAVRGLTVQPTVVKRFLERVDLRYDPRRPAPLETTLRMEDRILIGPAAETEVEFLMLPKEES